jgi:hypothetical protein
LLGTPQGEKKRLHRFRMPYWEQERRAAAETLLRLNAAATLADAERQVDQLLEEGDVDAVLQLAEETWALRRQQQREAERKQAEERAAAERRRAEQKRLVVAFVVRPSTDAFAQFGDQIWQLVSNNVPGVVWKNAANQQQQLGNDPRPVRLAIVPVSQAQTLMQWLVDLDFEVAPFVP